MFNRRIVKSDVDSVADGHERGKNFLSEKEMEQFLNAARKSRNGIRDHLILLMMFRHNRITTPMGCFRKMHTAARTIAGIELMNMIKKNQLNFTKHIDQNLTPAQQFYRLATI